MPWNYRVRKRVFDGETYYDFVEAYYDTEEDANNNKQNAYTVESIAPGTDTVLGLRWILEAMKEAFDKPIIEDSEEKDDGKV